MATRCNELNKTIFTPMYVSQNPCVFKRGNHNICRIKNRFLSTHIVETHSEIHKFNIIHKGLSTIVQ